MDLSVIVPIQNEFENIHRLHRKVKETLEPTALEYELVLVDDGSSDGSTHLMRDLAWNDPRVRVIELRRNFGQSAAMLAGIRESRGAYVVMMDGDLQNDPADIPKMISKLSEGFDLVHGWRKNRKDRWLDRRLPSWVANKLISHLTQFPVHDLGCTLKLMRREVALELELYGEMHRFIPILADIRGARCVELDVKHHPRMYGRTKYGLGRTIRVLLDLITVVYLQRYAARPMKLFGRWALLSGFVAFLLAVTTVAASVLDQQVHVPLFIGTLMTGAVAMQFFSIGCLAEMATRISYAGRNESSYAVRYRWEQRTMHSSGHTPPTNSGVWRKAG
jgi:glycosyltransferase involved in cell wall biosynthesis